MRSLLQKLHISEINPGACTGPEWIRDPDGDKLTSFNPSTGDAIAAVELASVASYDAVATAAAQSFHIWRELPAPKRGEVVRDLGNALRELKEPLGDLVTLEMGKIPARARAKCRR